MKTEILIGYINTPLVFGERWEVYFLSQHEDRWVKMGVSVFAAKPTKRQVRQAKKRMISRHRELLIG